MNEIPKLPSSLFLRNRTKSRSPRKPTTIPTVLLHECEETRKGCPVIEAAPFTVYQVEDFRSEVVSGMEEGSGEYVRIGVGSPPRKSVPSQLASPRPISYLVIGLFIWKVNGVPWRIPGCIPPTCSLLAALNLSQYF
ncbi:protein ASPARTIC PROTEASE IN GUARD CELL 2-like [Tripterygium wilfordii]|uniref:Protein ASPARTIC PROTEASE IN GUARD CELL 2-like n=1 Tax=Tripterygium wilfordii TaxID=458696 RepID=A0A7J7CVR4_TRIWF|nr:protein ASPARTIC PROTEASE IN GUARD CELL 2-like [Tripterygium wilfordii]